ncbi:MAG: DNA mismatch repair endonuclease MutL, partial [Clostridia bacterium]|nr:DNA mismatch repair endonuclease MutL [Clostridia bacterium]
MPRVRCLDPATASRIAAGEVVERPAAVVKELVENALDAGARRVEVELEEGGCRLVTVVDDGCGMSPQDAVLALERHATSKITTLEDLDRLQTLGFRGEALPSVVAVASVEVVTREREALAGVRLLARAGRVLAVEEVPAPPGTRVTVRDLFHSVPARRKYLRSPSAELARCLQVVTALALAFPEVAFHVRHNGRVAVQTPGGGDRLDAIASLYGLDLAERLLPVAGKDEGKGVGVEGFVAAPDAARAGRTAQHCFVNRRPVVSPVVRAAVEDAFHGLVPLHRHPVFFLWLSVDPALVDVNVHPAKRFVRFQDEGAVRAAVLGAVRGALASGRLTAPADGLLRT